MASLRPAGPLLLGASVCYLTVTGRAHGDERFRISVLSEKERAVIQAIQPTSSADGVEWDLHDLYGGVDDPRISADLDAALKRAQAFEGEYRGKINVVNGPAPEFVVSALTELEGLSEQMDKPAIFAQLLHAAKTDDPKRGALVSKTREGRTLINKHLIFFDLEWVKLPHEAARPLIDAPALARYRHYLEQKRAWRPHYLTEPEEKILDEKNVTGRAAWVRLFDETVSAIQCPFEYDGRVERVAKEELLAKLYDADRSVRQAAANGITRGLQENARLLTYIFNNLVLDHKSDCELRHFDGPMAPR